jgi:hypothetical protein
LENSLEIIDDIVVPDADHPIAEGAQLVVALPVFAAFRMLAAVEFDDRVPVAANKSTE